MGGSKDGIGDCIILKRLTGGITRLQDYTLFLCPEFPQPHKYAIYLFKYILLCIYILILYIIINIYTKLFYEKTLVCCVFNYLYTFLFLYI